LIVGSRGLGGDVVGDRPYPIRGTRQEREQLRQFAIHSFTNNGALLLKAFGRRGVELRLGTQVLDELLKVSLEANALNDFVHLAADAFHLGEALLVDGFGGDVVQRRVLGRTEAIKVASIR